jgi:hypothetical protein
MSRLHLKTLKEHASVLLACFLLLPALVAAASYASYYKTELGKAVEVCELGRLMNCSCSRWLNITSKGSQEFKLEMANKSRKIASTSTK